MTVSAVSLTIQALLAAGGVTATVSTRIEPDPLSEDTANPAIAVSLAGEAEDRLLAGMSGYPMAEVDIHCLADDPKTAIEIGEAVKTALKDLLFTHGGYNADFEKQGVDFTDYDGNPRTCRRLLRYGVRWRAA